MAVYCRNIERAGRIDCGLYTAEPGADEKVISFLSRALEARPRSAPLLEARSQAYAMQGDWKRAASDYLSLTELNPDNLQTWMRAATLFARAGETARYQEVFQKMLMRIGSIEDIARADNAEKVAKTGLIMATPDSILESATKLALQANRVAATKAGQAWVLPWSQLTLGWAEFRNGEYAKAITLCENSLAHGRLADRDALAKVILAMAHFHVNEVQEAQRALDEADQILEDNLDLAARFRVSNWHDLIICSLLREEARDLFQRGS